MGAGQIELMVLNEIQQFYLNKHSLDCCKSVINFQSSGKVDSDHFLSIFSLLYGGENFWRFLLRHSH